MNFFDKENLADIAEKTTIVINGLEAKKAEKISTEERAVIQKVTLKNFYTNKRFYLIVGSLIVAGASGNIAGGVPLVTELLGMFF